MHSFHHALSVRFQETYSSQLAEVGTDRCVDINYGISDVNAHFTVHYFSSREIRELSIDIETKVLSDLDEKVHRLEEHLLERPELAKVINNV